MLPGLLRLIVISLIIYIVYLVVKAWQSVSGGRAARKPPAGGTMVKDEVCNTYVPRDEALRLVRNGQEHFFCSEACRRTFLESGERRSEAGQ